MIFTVISHSSQESLLVVAERKDRVVQIQAVGGDRASGCLPKVLILDLAETDAGNPVARGRRSWLSVGLLAHSGSRPGRRAAR